MTDSNPPLDNTGSTDSTERETNKNSSTDCSLQIPTSQLLAELRRLTEVKGRSPTMREMNKEGKHAASTFQNRFGSWSNALEELGLEPRRPRVQIQVTKQDIRDDIRDLANQLGYVPTVSEMQTYGQYSPKTAQARFGSWNAAIRAAGFQPNHENLISDKRLLDEIRRLAEKLGYPPSTNDLKREGRFTHRPYFRRFDDWQSAVRAAGYEPRGWPSGPESPRWTGGRTSHYYGPNWNSQRLRTLQRDDFKCQMPGCEATRESHYKEFETDLHIHHIMPVETFLESSDPNYEAMNKLDNLVTLCVSHHAFWEQLSPLRPDIRE